jgi:predicted DNA-binding transcriptional regulator AlpA
MNTYAERVDEARAVARAASPADLPLLLRTPVAAELLSMPKKSLCTYAKTVPGFPQPIKLRPGSNIHFWRRDDILRVAAEGIAQK